MRIRPSITLMILLTLVTGITSLAQNQTNKTDSIRRFTNPSKQGSFLTPTDTSRKLDHNAPWNQGTLHDAPPSGNKSPFLLPMQTSNIGCASVYGMLGISRGEFKTVSNGDFGMGFGFAAMKNFLGTHEEEKNFVGLYLGGSFDYLYFGGKNADYVADDKTTYYLQNTVSTNVNQNAYALQLVSRITFFNGRFIPFIEGSTGGRWFNGVHKVTVTNDLKSGYSQPNFTPTSKSDRVSISSSVVGVYSIGGGLLIGASNIKLEIKYMYNFGSTAKYVDMKTVEIDAANSVVKYKTKSSQTDMVVPQIGVTVNF